MLTLEQSTVIETAYSAWKADVLPLNYDCIISGQFILSTAKLP